MGGASLTGGSFFILIKHIPANFTFHILTPNLTDSRFKHDDLMGLGLNSKIVFKL